MDFTQSPDPRTCEGTSLGASNVYIPLASNQTRFLTIFPASSLDDEIYSEIVSVSLEDEVIASYEALSYTWDRKMLTHSISVNKSQLKITANLFDALRHFRDKEKARTTWIDAVCINQQDMAERSQQVLLMRKIYSTVRRVVIWLSKELEGSDSGLRLLSERLGELNSSEIRAAAGTLFERPWWYRSWIIQEFLKAQEAIFLCGSVTLNWGEIIKIVEAFSPEEQWHDQKYRHIVSFLLSKNSKCGIVLRNLMICFGHSQATDPRDKIYAFLGIASDGLETIPDYTASVQQIYTDLVKSYIRKERNL